MSFNTQVKVIAACVTTCLILLVGAILCFGMIGYNTHEWQIYQSISDHVSVVNTPGYYWKDFGTVETEAAANLEKKKATVEANKLREVAVIDKQRAVVDAQKKVEVAAQEKQEAETRRQIADIQAVTAELKKKATISAAEAEQQEIEIAGRLAEKDRVLAEIKAERDARVAASLANVKVPGVVIISGSANSERASEGMTDTLMNLLLLKSTGVIDPTTTPTSTATK